MSAEPLLKLGDKVETEDGERGTVEQIHPEMPETYLISFQPKLAWYSGVELYGPVAAAPSSTREQFRQTVEEVRAEQYATWGEDAPPSSTREDRE